MATSLRCGAVIDGQHRLVIASELGIEVRFDIRPGLTDEQKDALAESLNRDRRHLSVEQRDELLRVKVLVDKMSLRQAAKDVGVSEATARRAVSRAGATGDAPARTVIGQDGKTYPAKKADTAERFERAAKARVLADNTRT